MDDGTGTGRRKLRQTKIVATLGPATDSGEVIASMIRCGLDVARVNFSHGKIEDHAARIELVRKHASLQNKSLAILVDLQGPKIRVTKFKSGEIELKKGDPFEIDVALDKNAGTARRVGATYKNLPKEVMQDDILCLNDGNIKLIVTDVSGSAVKTEVLVGGTLSDSKGIDKEGGGLGAMAPSLTSKDQQDIEAASELNADYLAVSFVKTKDDVENARKILQRAGGKGGIVAKIERLEAVKNIDEIIDASDGIMIARGDLGVEIGNAKLPGEQKRLIKKARQKNRFVITATQMMTSMTKNPEPTRAEVLDVANAVLDGTDAVMLSEESAVGEHPALVIETMDEICRGSESSSLQAD